MIPGIVAGYTRGASAPSIVTSGLVANLDAKNYTSGQVWANSVVSPADGSAQTAYDFHLGDNSGTEGVDPTIVNLGADDAYWLFGGSQYFNLASSPTVPAFIRNMHKAGAKYTIEAWVLLSGTVGANVQPFFDSGTSDQGGSDTSRGAIFFDLANYPDNNIPLNFRVKRQSSGVSDLAVHTDSVLAINSVLMTSVSFDGAGDQASFFYRNGSYMQVSGNDTWSGLLTSPSALDTAQAPKIGARGDGNFRLPANNRLYVMRMYNRNLSKAELDQNWAASRARFGL